MDNKFDLAVLGAGPGGYPAAIKAAQAGYKVALIEAKDVGGTCLNRGCIPTKTLLANAEILSKIRHAKDFGVSVGKVSFDFKHMTSRKDEVVTKLRTSLEGLIKTNQITLLRGYGKFISPTEIKVTGDDNLILTADKTIIATGSEPRDIAAFPFDFKRIHNSTSILEMKTLPKSLVIIGGGYIGCEFASLYSELGVQVTIIEALPTIISTEPPNVSTTLTKTFEDRGIEILTNTTVEGVDTAKTGVSVRLTDGKPVKADIALVSVGRKLNTENIGLDKAGVLTEDNGMVPVNKKMETSVPGIYAIGDICSQWMLAHVATHQGIVAASNVIGENAEMHYHAIPSVIFTEPEIGSVGLSLEKALEENIPATIGVFPFSILGKSQATQDTEGFAQVVVNKNTKQILGAQVVGHSASALVGEMAIAIANEMTIDSITETVHAHPTVTEAWMEAAMIINESPLHYPPKKRRSRKS